MIKKINILLLILFASGIWNLGFPQKMQKDAELKKLIERAVEVSPKLKLIKQKQKSAEAVIPQVSNWKDPVLVLGLNNLPINSFSFTQEPMTGKVAALSQAIPFPGRLDAAGQFKASDVEIIGKEFEDTKNQLIADVEKLYFELSFTRKAIEVTEKNKSLLKSIEKVVRTKYEVGKASQQNLIRITLEITRLDDKLEELRGKENSLVGEINALLLLPENNKIESGNLDEITHGEFSVDSLLQISIDNRPALKQIQLYKNKFKIKEDLAKYDFYPNFNVKVQYSQRDEIAKTNTSLNDFVSLFVGFNLPLNYGGKTEAKVEEAQILQKVFDEKYNTLLQSLQKSFSSLKSKLDELKQREILTQDGLIPQAEQSLKAALASYQVGDVDFINVIDSQNRLYQIELMLYKLRSNYNKTMSQIEFLTGTEF